MIETSGTLALTPDSEKIHDLRLDIKKVKAVADLLKTTYGHQGNFSLKQLKPLFQLAGSIRTAELNVNLFNELRFHNEDLELAQRRTIIQGYALFGIKRREFKKEIEKIKGQFEKDFKKIRNRKVLEYFHRSLNELSLGFLWPIDTEHLHENRKKLKDLLYILKFLPAELRERITLNTDYLDKLQEMIGQWHDLLITSELLSAHCSKDSPAVQELDHKIMAMLDCIKKQAEYFDQKVISAAVAEG